MRRGFVDTSVGQIHYREMGSGEPLVLLHETPRSSGVFLDVIPMYAEHFWVIAMDTPGYGDSDDPPSDPGIEGFARTVGEVMDALGVEKAHVQGRHTGCSIAVEFAATYPDRVMRLVLDGCPDYDAETRKERLAGVHSSEFTTDGSHFTAAWEYGDKWRHGRASPEAIHRAGVDVLKSIGRTDYGHKAVFLQDVRTRIPKITAPTLLISAREDVFVERHELIKPFFNDARTYVFENSFRFPTEEEPEAMTKLVTDFLRE
jgi:pimeloyl-ACP methyl ester carboxylesterase